MKIRADFVTNSSSSSFVTIEFDGEKLSEIISEYVKSPEDVDYNDDLEELPFNENGLYLEGEYSFQQPESKYDIGECIINLFEELTDYYDEIYDLIPEYDDLLNKLRENLQEIVDTLYYLEWSYGNEEWGDGEARLYTGFDDEEIREFMHLKNNEEIDYDKFYDKLADASYRTVKTVSYKDGKFTTSEEHELM